MLNSNYNSCKASLSKSHIPTAEVIVFLRSQKELVNSLHNQSLKTGWFNKPMTRFLWSKKNNYTLNDFFNYNPDCFNWDYSPTYVNHNFPLNIHAFNYVNLIDLYKELLETFAVEHEENCQELSASFIALEKAKSEILPTLTTLPFQP